MRWSKYNLLYESERHGFLLYNALTNTFAALPESVYTQLQRLKSQAEELRPADDPALYLQLVQMGALVGGQAEEDALNQIRLRRNLFSYDNTRLELSIAPTLACNFNCPYCYERSRPEIYLDQTVEDQIIDFIGRFKHVDRLTINWVGGEPLLNFDRILSLNSRIAKLGLPWSANMITNGYLLDDKVIARLPELQMKALHLTLDGPAEIHDRRRRHKDRGPTFEVILANMEKLVAAWLGDCVLRVNVDRSNMDHFAQVHELINKRLPGRKISLYPGIISDSPTANPDLHCQFDRQDVVDFNVGLYRRHGLETTIFYPNRHKMICVAKRRNSFVIGPEGEVYKCWRDLGVKDMVLGSIGRPDRWNMDLYTRYMVGVDHFNDPVCAKCFYLPVCDGGCPNQRLKNKYLGRDFDTCAVFKHRLPEYLDIYYEQQQAGWGRTVAADQPGPVPPK